MKVASLFLCLMIAAVAWPADAARLTQEQNKIAREAFQDAQKKQWSSALGHARRVGDPLTLSIMQWHYASSSGTDPDFSLIRNLVRAHPDWPLMEALKAEAERALMREPVSVSKIEDWLKKHPAVTGAGPAALGLALPNNDARRPELLRQAWREGGFSGDLEDKLYSAALPHLKTSDHITRIERLLWDDQASAAERMVDMLPSNRRALYKARIGLQQRARNVNQLVSAVPSAQQNDFGLRYDRLRWRQAKGLKSGVLEILRGVGADAPHPDKWWRYRAIYGRDYIEDKAYKKAHAIMTPHGLKPTLHTAAFADAMWMLGWSELRFLDNAKDAYKRFYAMFNAVGTPVSKARAAYWAGRAAKADGHEEIAHNWFAQAAKHPTVFYGQLAHAELVPNQPLPLPSKGSTIAERNKVARLSLFQAVEVLYHVEQYDLAKRFLKHGIDVVKSSEHKIAFADAMATKLKWMHGGVVGAKQALREHAVALEYGWPLAKAPSGPLPLAPELMFAIARQESEMHPRARSHADARGLMQLLPGTAKGVAKKVGVGYSLSKLYETDYNMRLGSRYLGDLIEDFNGNWVLAIAGYNAGPRRSDQWVERFGYPPSDLYKRLDWLETIPFKETRNYVQRVLENAQVYRARMKSTAPNTLKADILR